MTFQELLALRIELTRPKKNSSEDPPRKKTEDELVFEGMIELLKSDGELDNFQAEYLKSRLVNQIVYMDGKSNKCKKQYIKSQMTSIIGGVVVTALVGLSTFVPDEKYGDIRKFFGVTAFIVSQVVTVTSAVEQLHKNNELWLFYRRSNEYMKSQLWHFLELTGPYENIDRKTAFRILVKQSEEIIPRDLDILSAKSKENNISVNPEPDNKKKLENNNSESSE